MKTVLSVCLGFLIALPAVAQSNKAWVYKLSPTPGNGTQLEMALANHVEWRSEADDPWTWNVYEEITGSDLGSFHITSGGHAWADFDSYTLSGADEHFDSIVSPHVGAAASAIIAQDTTAVNWPASADDARLLTLAYYDIKIGMLDDFLAAIKKYHEGIMATGHPTYYAFHTAVSGSDGWEVVGVFPTANFAGFESKDPTLGAVLAEHFGQEEFQQLVEDFESTLNDARSVIVVHRPDLSID